MAMNPLDGQISDTSRLFSNIGKADDAMQAVSGQISSGNKYSTYKELSKDGAVENYITLQSRVNSYKAISSNNEKVVNRLKSMESAIEQMQNIATDFASTLVQRQGPTADSLPFSQEADSALERIADALNARSEGRYLFSGSKTDTAPVSNIAVNNYSSDGESTSAYYEGNTVVLEARISENQTISYGVTGDNDAFADLIGAINLAIDADAEDDTEDLQTAIDLINDAIESLASLRAEVANNRNIVTNAEEANGDAQLLLETSINEVGATDIVEATTIMQELQAQIEASYIAWTRLTQLRLSDYL